MTKASIYTMKRNLQAIGSRTLVVALGFSALLNLPLTNAYGAQDDWVFNVEFFAFKRTLPSDNTENFDVDAFDPENASQLSAYTLRLLRQMTPELSDLNSLELCDEQGATLSGDIDGESNSYPMFNESELAGQSELSDAVNAGDVQQASDLNDVNVGEEAFGDDEQMRTVIGFMRTLVNEEEGDSVSWFVDEQTWVKDGVLHPEPVNCVSAEQQTDILNSMAQSFTITDTSVINNRAIYSNLNTDIGYLNGYIKKVSAQAGIEPLVYKRWRQPVVFGEENAMYYKVLGGERLDTRLSETDKPMFEPEAITQTNELGENTDLNDFPSSFPLPNNEALSGDEATGLVDTNTDANTRKFSENEIMAQLAILKSALENDEQPMWDEYNFDNEATNTSVDTSDTPLEDPAEERIAPVLPVWELDGIFKVYLDYVNRVPYLHIDSEMLHSALALDEQGMAHIQHYPSKQRRRIISKQIHYFDHPAFGVIIRLERYEKPELIETIESEVLR